jgi:hypothetical protein
MSDLMNGCFALPALLLVASMAAVAIRLMRARR